MRTKQNECYTCAHSRTVPGNTHLRCSNPDPLMTGVPHGIANGWFHYPGLFDPTWKARECETYTGDTPL